MTKPDGMKEVMRSKTEVQRECERVNKILKEEAIALQLGTKTSMKRLEDSKTDAGIGTFSFWAELEFREYVRRNLEQHQSMTISTLILGGARLLGVSPMTTKRYMNKLRAENGPFGGLGDVVVINSRYIPREEDPYWRDNDVENT